MGGLQSKVEDALQEPENLKRVKELYTALDKNKDGTLDKAEWLEFGNILFELDVKKVVEEESKNEQKDARDRTGNIPFLSSMAAAEVKDAINKHLKAIDVDNWINDMFAKADVNVDGRVSFEEFEKFLKGNKEIVKETKHGVSDVVQKLNEGDSLVHGMKELNTALTVAVEEAVKEQQAQQAALQAQQAQQADQTAAAQTPEPTQNNQ
eukprot:TRINITY_DN1268_c0_g1_i1.p1 TRINITY_DN1268_c0_g1~~TRINITY_DN1268_c0_g1_i1.p1  ORF type:complete len:236 (+),score=78.78 TRINITY_DN1268_c0_g1_i1:86-709(+)